MTALLRMSGGLIVWAVAFCVLYALHGIGCGAGWATMRIAGVGLHRAALVAAWLACLAAGGAVVLATRSGRDGAALIERTAWRIALVGLAATAITGLPIVTIPACL
ncbi:hypothetical protein [Sphingomonas sp. RS2018]